MIEDTGVARRCDHGSVGKASRTSSDGDYLPYLILAFYSFDFLSSFRSTSIC